MHYSSSQWDVVVGIVYAVPVVPIYLLSKELLHNCFTILFSILLRVYFFDIVIISILQGDVSKLGLATQC